MFTLPQQHLADCPSASAAGVLTAEAFTTDGHGARYGTLQVIDNQVDPTTGTVRLKADFPNAKFQLWPGQFVNVRLLVDTLKMSSLRRRPPSSAARTAPYVYVVSEDKTVPCARSKSRSRTKRTPCSPKA